MWTRWQEPIEYVCIPPGVKFDVDPQKKAEQDSKLEQAKRLLGDRYCLSSKREPLVKKRI